MRRLEICCGDLQSVKAAVAGGADRIELCTGLAEGGMTPSAALIREAVRIAGDRIKVHVLIRPRPGDFCYDDDEKAQILGDTAFIVGDCPGVAGLVFGALTLDGDIDTELCLRFMKLAGDKSTTFHRAFDLCKGPFEAMERIISLGFDRILTSGHASSAYEGIETLARLNRKADGRIIILGGAGVNSSNAAEIIKRSGLTELHASARRCIASAMRFRNEGVAMGAPGEDEYSRPVTSAEEVAALRQAVDINK